MGILAPLFLAGLAALSLPLILHLIHRTPRGRQEFSSLMFLSASPPRLTRRSRLDQILLLLVRMAVLALLAIAFARPFLRETALLSLGDLPPRKVAILLDTSASMRRGDLWQQALLAAERQLKDLAPQDEVALFTFSDRLQTIVPFAGDREQSPIPAAQIVRGQLASLQPNWAAGDFGLALTTLATDLDAASDVDQTRDEPQMIVISDFQKGSRTDVLQAFEWPQQVKITVEPLAAKQLTNASVQVLESDEDSQQEPRVRVINAANSRNDQFYVGWSGAEQGKARGEETAVYVPPGQSRVVRLPRPENNPTADRVVLRGDDQDFDNTHYVVAPLKQEVRLIYAGVEEANDTRGLQYYLRLAADSDGLRHIDVQILDDDNLAKLREDNPPQLVVVARSVAPDVEQAIATYVEAGGTLLLVATDRQAAQAWPRFYPDLELADDAERSEGKYALLSEIDYTHPVFTAFANPRYADFTKIHFWRHRTLKLKPQATTSVVARFDNGDPWLLERTLGRGRALAMTSGWQPDDSQLAVSSKFVPLVGGLLDQACGAAKSLAGVAVNQRVALPKPQAEAASVRLPDGRDVALAAGAATFSQTEQPGVYRIAAANESWQFAVNISPSESDTTPLEMEQLEQLGVPLGGGHSREAQLNRLRQERDTELEGRQKIWRWLLATCLVLLIVETWFSGRLSREAREPMRAAA